MATTSSAPLATSEIDSLDEKQPAVSGTPETRFLRRVITYFNNWIDLNEIPIKNGQIPAGRALVLMYSESPLRDPGIDTTLFTSPEEVHETGYAVSDGLTVCTENFHTMVSWVPAFNNANGALTFIKKHLKADQTFALMYMGRQQVCLHHPGQDVEDWIRNQAPMKLNRDPDQVVDPPTIIKRLELFHQRNLEQPGGITARRMWEIHTHPKKSTLRSGPEGEIQSFLLVYLHSEFRRAGVIVDEEIRVNGKRVDVRVMRAFPGQDQISTMIELKVLDPAKSQAANLDWARSGITQANDYKVVAQTDVAIASIYDARHNKVAIRKELADYAKEKVVTLLFQKMDPPPPRPLKTTAGTPVKQARVPAAKKTAAPAKKSSARKMASAGTRSAAGSTRKN